MKILAIDTSCDETAAAVTENVKVLSNIIWSQASAHAKFGGVMPSLAQRMHEERIDFVIEKALRSAFPKSEHNMYDMIDTNIDAIAVTVGPGLSIALGVGIDRAKKLAIKYKKPLIPINHVEAHILSSMAIPNSKSSISNAVSNFDLPIYGLCVSGGNTIFTRIDKIGEYKVLAETQDDALGEALDKGARMLGLGYPGGAILEKMAKLGDSKRFKLPIPLVGQEDRMIFSYSGLKTSFHRLTQANHSKTKQEIYDLAAAFQNVAFKHIERVLSFYFTNNQSSTTNNLLFGGGVAANLELRKRLRKLGDKYNFKLRLPYSKKLLGDNAAMIGVCAYLNYHNQDLSKFTNIDSIDRSPNLRIA